VIYCSILNTIKFML